MGGLHREGKLKKPSGICLPITYCFYFFTGKQVFLSGDSIPNNGYVNIGDIGSTDNTSLHCHTGCYGPHSRGDWIAPDGTRVSSGSVPGFRITRSPEFVGLLRKTGTQQEGIYHCVVENETATLHRVRIGIYSLGAGKIATVNVGACLHKQQTFFDCFSIQDTLIYLEV